MIITTEKRIERLQETLEGNFSNCHIIGKYNSDFYSPYILALTGLFLIKIKSEEINPLLNTIDSILTNNSNNKNRIFNFYGDNSYYYDLDTTSVVNTYFKIRNLSHIGFESLKNKVKVQKEINLYMTWLNRERNYVDWVVNLNFSLYEFLCTGESNLHPALTKYLNDYMRNGSRYYKRKDFPVFWLYFLSKEYGYPIFRHGNKKIEIFKKSFIEKIRDIEIDEIESLNNLVFFNSSKYYFSSLQLSTAISLYLNKNN